MNELISRLLLSRSRRCFAFERGFRRTFSVLSNETCVLHQFPRRVTLTPRLWPRMNSWESSDSFRRVRTKIPVTRTQLQSPDKRQLIKVQPSYRTKNDEFSKLNSNKKQFLRSTTLSPFTIFRFNSLSPARSQVFFCAFFRFSFSSPWQWEKW